MIDWEILYKIPLGLYVLGADDGKSPAGAVIDAVMVASNQPCTLAISCGNNGYTKQTIDKSLCFSLSVLPKDISPFVIANFGFFSSNVRNKWDFVEHQKFHELPVINDALAFIYAKVIHKYELCSNTVFVAEIIDAQINRSGDNLLYQDYRGKLKNDVVNIYQQILKEEKNG